MPLPNQNRLAPADAIRAYIGGYDSPEAAQRLIPFSVQQSIRSQYGDLTGDAFADPFDEARIMRDRQVAEAAASGASVSVGSNRGSRLLSAPTVSSPMPAANGQPPPMIPTNMEGSPLSPLGVRTTQNSLMTSMLQRQGQQHSMAGTDLMVPPPDANNYLNIIEQRASLSGSRDLFDKIQRSNPNVFSSGTASDDPRFAKVQGGKEGKIEAADALHPIALDTTFMQEARRNPTKAKALYAAVTNGRDYDTDIAGKSQLLAEQRDSRKKLIEGIKNVEADPVTGELFKVVESKDLGGKISQQRVPLNPMDKAAIEAEGGFKRIYGVDLPDRGGLPPLQGTTAEEQIAYRTRTQELMKKNSTLTVAAASKLAHRQLYEEQRDKVATQEGRPPWVHAADTMAKFMGNTVNAFTDTVVNPIIQGGDRAINDPLRAMGLLPQTRAAMIPPLPIPSEMELEEQYAATPSLMDIFRNSSLATTR